MAGLSLLKAHPVTGRGDHRGGVALASVNIGRSFLLALALGQWHLLAKQRRQPMFPALNQYRPVTIPVGPHRSMETVNRHLK
jgi:hypothetical protein